MFVLYNFAQSLSVPKEKTEMGNKVFMFSAAATWKSLQTNNQIQDLSVNGIEKLYSVCYYFLTSSMLVCIILHCFVYCLIFSVYLQLFIIFQVLEVANLKGKCVVLLS